MLSHFLLALKGHGLPKYTFCSLPPSLPRRAYSASKSPPHAFIPILGYNHKHIILGMFFAGAKYAHMVRAGCGCKTRRSGAGLLLGFHVSFSFPPDFVQHLSSAGIVLNFLLHEMRNTKSLRPGRLEMFNSEHENNLLRCTDVEIFTPPPLLLAPVRRLLRWTCFLSTIPYWLTRLISHASTEHRPCFGTPTCCHSNREATRCTRGCGG